jgi:DNA repair protein RecN (Recombination protein N)
MLKNLRIQNLILIEKVEIDFTEGFNVLSGETGSGKSALMEALSLVLGERADNSVIRNGSDRGVVEACFDIGKIEEIKSLLREAGIDSDGEDNLYLRRELSVSGKNRTLINHQQVHLNLLKQIGRYLVKFVGQHANRQLFEIEYHRNIVDQYGELEELLAQVSSNWHLEMELRNRIEDLTKENCRKVEEIGRLKHAFEEISQATLKEGEEESLFNEYSRLNHSEELLNQGTKICAILSDQERSILSVLGQQKQVFEKLKRLDPSLEEICKNFQQGIVELQEVSFSLHNYLGRLDSSPKRIDEINERLSLISKLKKKYGSSVKEIETYLAEIEKQLNHLESLDLQLEDLKNQLNEKQKESEELAAELTRKRSLISKKLSKELIEQLRDLNMPKVEFEIRMTPQKRSSFGNDLIEFFMAPNVGERLIAVKECASGGELSRLMLALNVLLADKENISTLVFDEIDANIGGATASIVGDKLKSIGRDRQVLCVTHFPQVAAKAHHHLQISKMEVENRTLTIIRTLAKEERAEELARMRGE